MRDWTAAFRAPYYNHFTLVDWTGPMYAFEVPFARILFAPIQWLFEEQVKQCCAAVDCDSVDGSEADVCMVSRLDADPDACCRAQRPRPSRDVAAVRQQWSVPARASEDARERSSSTRRCALPVLSSWSSSTSQPTPGDESRAAAHQIQISAASPASLREFATRLFDRFHTIRNQVSRIAELIIGRPPAGQYVP